MWKICNGWVERPFHIYILLFAISGNFFQITIFNFDVIYCGSNPYGNTHVFVPFGLCHGIFPGRISVRFLGILFNIDYIKDNK